MHKVFLKEIDYKTLPLRTKAKTKEQSFPERNIYNFQVRKIPFTEIQRWPENKREIMLKKLKY